MRKEKLSEKKWFTGAVVACIGVVLYMLLDNLRTVISSVSFFLGSFRSIFLGMILAYILNPLANFFYHRLFRKMKVGKTRWYLSVTLGILTALLALILLIGTLIPQLVQSIALFSESYDTYAATLLNLLEKSPLQSVIDDEKLQMLSENALMSIAGFVRDNAGKILTAAANSGKGIISAAVSMIVAVYLLIDKKGVMKGLWRFGKVLLPPERIAGIMDFSLRCDSILMRYLGQSLLESLVVGLINAVFMAACGMEYVGLVSVIVAVTNLIPNFGPIIGAVIGGFILVLVKPFDALMFVAFCVVLQFFDGYILKPKLFSGSLGVSGLLILIAGIVLGNLFGVIGMLLSIPAAAIMSFIYREYFLPKAERRFQNKPEPQEAKAE